MVRTLGEAASVSCRERIAWHGGKTASISCRERIAWHGSKTASISCRERIAWHGQSRNCTNRTETQSNNSKRV
jgi:hypothetical protein